MIVTIATAKVHVLTDMADRGVDLLSTMLPPALSESTKRVLCLGLPKTRGCLPSGSMRSTDCSVSHISRAEGAGSVMVKRLATTAANFVAKPEADAELVRLGHWER
ncbi:hypothetical protein MLPF_1941 [Mycobacterium lepromatosis]|nr:hypothetical protein MLPF_1941 [Mycobacterium lepromatosis]